MPKTGNITYRNSGYSSGYTVGYADGLTNAMDNINIEYVYHEHFDNSGTSYVDGNIIYSTSNPGGCYTADKHTHDKTSICPKHTESHSETYIKEYCGCTGDHDSGNVWCDHGSHGLRKCGKAIYATRKVETTIYDCDESINTWKIGCGKITGVIDSVTIKY